MYYGNIIKADVANGEGIRLSVFVSGCTNRCEGCFNEMTWDFRYGKPWTKETEDFVIKELSLPYYKGLTILGGEPFEISNQKDVSALIKRVREELPDKDIWVYTGFTYEKDLIPGGCRYTEYTDDILNKIDILVDGRFILSEKDISLQYRGSKNQRIIDVKKSSINEIILKYT